MAGKKSDDRAQCFLCGNGIVFEDGDPLLITIDYGGGEQQELYAHGRCLKRVTHKSVPLLIEEP
jgi:hypothetical protein